MIPLAPSTSSAPTAPADNKALSVASKTSAAPTINSKTGRTARTVLSLPGILGEIEADLHRFSPIKIVSRIQKTLKALTFEDPWFSEIQNIMDTVSQTSGINQNRDPVNHQPTYRILSQVLAKDKQLLLNQFLNNQYPQQQWYGRLNFWIESFEGFVDAKQAITFEHKKEHPSSSAVDDLATILLNNMQSLGADLKGKKIHLEAYLDRNEVKKSQKTSNPLSWHRDQLSINGQDEVADYTLVYLMSPETNWKGGDMLLQLGGKATSRHQWQNSKEPIVRIHPRCNQIVILKNSNAVHMVESIEPVEESVQRDILVITCALR